MAPAGLDSERAATGRGRPAAEGLAIMGYPVQVTIARDNGQNRLWGLLGLGSFVRALLCIPQAIVLFLLAFVVWLAALLSWIPILVNGRQAGWVYWGVGGVLRLTARVNLYVGLVTGAYPPIGPEGTHTVEVVFDQSEAQNRLWGIPFVGALVRVIVLLPHLIVLWALGIVVGFLVAFSWLPVLISGRQADLVVQLVGGYYRWYTRVSAYALLLTAAYPPFSLD